MDKLTQYRTLLIQLLNQHADLMNSATRCDWEAHTIFDEVHDRYMIFRAGWRDKERIHIPTLYVRLYQGKFWIEEDWTEDGIATELLAVGVPHQDIVLAFRHPEMRPFTEFAAT
jgi:hypothetical protein